MWPYINNWADGSDTSVASASLFIHNFRGRGLARILVEEVWRSRHIGLKRLRQNLSANRRKPSRLGLLGVLTLVRIPDYVKDMQAHARLCSDGVRPKDDEEYAGMG
jgi:hypothetical protein